MTYIVKPVRLYGKEMVGKVSEEVVIFGDVLRPEIEDLFNTMLYFNGLGIAAPQLHIFKRIFIIGTREQHEVFINPKIVDYSQEFKEREEGCLSIPGASAKVSRRETCVVEYQNIDGEVQHLEMRGMASVAAQHELDHLDGLFYVDRIGAVRRKLIIDKLKKQIRAAEKHARNGHA